MMMTAAGTVPAARVFVMGAGVAGLQAIATARRLGAVVTATDVRPAAKEQVESLGAKFVAVEDDEFKQAETAAGYAKPMSAEYQAKQAALVAEHIKKQDIVITTALIPGRPAPRLVSAAMVASMRPGSVIVDLAVERGGNVEGAKPGEVAEVGGVKIVGYLNVAGPHRGERLGALCAQPLRLRRDADRQGDEGARGQLGRRTGQGDRPDARRQGRPSGVRRRGSKAMSELTPDQAQPRARPRRSRAAEAAQNAAMRPLPRRPMPTRSPTRPARPPMRATGGAIDPFVFRLAIFVLAIFVGYYVVWSVTPALHTPLMSVTNAISSVIVVGALLAVGVGRSTRRRRSAATGGRAPSASSR